MEPALEQVGVVTRAEATAYVLLRLEQREGCLVKLREESRRIQNRVDEIVRIHQRLKEQAAEDLKLLDSFEKTDA